MPYTLSLRDIDGVLVWGLVGECVFLPDVTKGRNELSTIPIDTQISMFSNGVSIETMDVKQALLKCYPGAVYKLQKTTYFVDDLDKISGLIRFLRISRPL